MLVDAESNMDEIEINGVVLEPCTSKKWLIKEIPASDKIFIDSTGIFMLCLFSLFLVFSISSISSKSLECKNHLIKCDICNCIVRNWVSVFIFFLVKAIK